MPGHWVEGGHWVNNSSPNSVAAMEEVKEAVNAAKNAGAPKSVLNRLKSSASKFKSWFMGRNNKGNSRWSRLGRTIKRTVFNRGILGRKFNANGKPIKGTSRWTRGYKAGQNFLNRFKSLNRFRSGATARRAERNQAEKERLSQAMSVGNAHSRRSRR